MAKAAASVRASAAPLASAPARRGERVARRSCPKRARAPRLPSSFPRHLPSSFPRKRESRCSGNGASRWTRASRPPRASRSPRAPPSRLPGRGGRVRSCRWPPLLRGGGGHGRGGATHGVGLRRGGAAHGVGLRRSGAAPRRCSAERTGAANGRCRRLRRFGAGGGHGRMGGGHGFSAHPYRDAGRLGLPRPAATCLRSPVQASGRAFISTWMAELPPWRRVDMASTASIFRLVAPSATDGEDNHSLSQPPKAIDHRLMSCVRHRVQK